MPLGAASLSNSATPRGGGDAGYVHLNPKANAWGTAAGAPHNSTTLSPQQPRVPAASLPPNPSQCTWWQTLLFLHNSGSKGVGEKRFLVLQPLPFNKKVKMADDLPLNLIHHGVLWSSCPPAVRTARNDCFVWKKGWVLAPRRCWAYLHASHKKPALKGQAALEAAAPWQKSHLK